jgi:hypothetical protein
VKKLYSQGWLSKVAVSGIIGGLFTITVFAPEINLASSIDVTSHNVVYFALNSHSMQAVFNNSIECLYLTEPSNSNISKMPASSQNIMPLFSAAFGFNADKLHQGRCICSSDFIQHKSLRQICLLLDLPPPSTQRLAFIA